MRPVGKQIRNMPRPPMKPLLDRPEGWTITRVCQVVLLRLKGEAYRRAYQHL